MDNMIVIVSVIGFLMIFIILGFICFGTYLPALSYYRFLHSPSRKRFVAVIRSERRSLIVRRAFSKKMRTEDFNETYRDHIFFLMCQAVNEHPVSIYSMMSYRMTTFEFAMVYRLLNALSNPLMMDNCLDSSKVKCSLVQESIANVFHSERNYIKNVMEKEISNITDPSKLDKFSPLHNFARAYADFKMLIFLQMKSRGTKSWVEELNRDLAFTMLLAMTSCRVEQKIVSGSFENPDYGFGRMVGSKVFVEILTDDEIDWISENHFSAECKILPVEWKRKLVEIDVENSFSS